MLYRRMRSKFSELVPNPFAERSCNKICSNQISEIVNFYSRYLKILSRTTEQISTKLGTKRPWVYGIQICTNEGPHTSSRGDNNKMIKIYGEYLTIFYFRTSWIVSTIIGIKYPWIEENQGFFFNKEQSPSTRGVNS